MEQEGVYSEFLSGYIVPSNPWFDAALDIPHDPPGVVELSCVPDPRVVWRIEDRSIVGVTGDPVTLVLRRPHGDAPVTGVWRSKHDGWSNGAVIGKADAPLHRIVTHWFNLPNLHGPVALTRTTETGEHWWLGRWEIEVGDGGLPLTSDPTTFGSGGTCTRPTSM